MSEAVATAADKAPSMGIFERYLTLWVALCIIVGIGLGQAVPGVFHALGTATVAQINLPVAVLVWLMVIPMLMKIDFSAIAAFINERGFEGAVVLEILSDAPLHGLTDGVAKLRTSGFAFQDTIKQAN